MDEIFIHEDWDFVTVIYSRSKLFHSSRFYLSRSGLYLSIEDFIYTFQVWEMENNLWLEYNNKKIIIII